MGRRESRGLTRSERASEIRRQFGGCVAVDGFVVQERAGDLTLLAVAVDLAVTTPSERTRVTLVLWPYRPVTHG